MSKKLLKSLPPPDHKYGYYSESVVEYAGRWGITPQELWGAFTSVPMVLERRTGKHLYDSDDIVKAVMKILKTRKSPTTSR
jgi:hypothetical protein